MLGKRDKPGSKSNSPKRSEDTFSNKSKACAKDTEAHKRAHTRPKRPISTKLLMIDYQNGKILKIDAIIDRNEVWLKHLHSFTVLYTTLTNNRSIDKNKLNNSQSLDEQ